jgi:hypothetical protein
MKPQVKTNGEASSRYSVQVEISPGVQKFGLLTYDLLAPDRGRSLILLNAETSCPSLNAEETASLNTLRSLINDPETLNAKGRTAQAKSLVRKLHEGLLFYPGKAIAVHRFGPVPALAIETDTEHRLPNGNLLRLRFGLYVGSERKAGRERVPAGCPSVVHFLESLKVQTTLIFRRYFQDVGEMLWAIQHKANLERALQWGKQAETVLAESVKSKLEEILEGRSKRGSEHHAHRRVARELRNEQAVEILKAAYGRLLILYLLNHLYEMLGISSKTEQYRDELKSFGAEMSKVFRDDTLELAFSDDTTLNELSRIREAFDDSLNRNSAGPMDLVSSERNWVRQTGGFARFLTVLRKHGTSIAEERAAVLDPRFAKIFFSSVHLVPSGAQVFNLLKAAMHGSKKPVRLLAVQEAPDAGFRELIQARLWLSDALIAIMPREPRRFEGTVGNYKWIGEEMALALMTRKTVSMARETGADPVRINADFEAVADSLFPWADKGEVVTRLAQHFADTVANEFTVTDLARPLDDRLKEQIDLLVDRALTRRTDKLVKGFLNQFPDSLLEHLEFLQLARHGAEASEMAEHLKRANRVLPDPKGRFGKKAIQRFRSLFAAASSRAMFLNKVTYPLMKSEKERKKKHSKYYWMLPAILQALRPWAGEEDLLQWEKELVAWGCSAVSKRTMGER